MKKRIAVILHGLSPNGVETMFAGLSALWDREKFEVHYLLAVDPDAKQYYEDQVIQNGCHVIHLHDLNGLRRLKWAFTLRRTLKEYGPFDVIHSNLSLLSGLNLWIARRAGIPVRIAHVHTIPSKARFVIAKIYHACMKPLIAQNATDRFACSEKAGEAAFGSASFQVVENGIDLAGFLNAAERRRDARDQKKQYRFVTVGRISQDKNPFFLLLVFRNIYRKLPEATLAWVGDGPLRRMAEIKAIELGMRDRIRFLGIRKDIPGILKEYDYFLFPSVQEGFGNALIEAQAAGLDCFVSDAVPEITDCGKVRFLPIGQTAEAWAERITAFIQSGQHMELDLERIERFDINRLAQRLMQTYSK